jgi:hypothetical protein
MKISNCFILFLFCNTLLSCSSNDTDRGEITGESGVSYNDSRTMWKELKAQNDETYNYTMSFISWSGFGSRTTITVKDGLVSKREYLYFEQILNEVSELEEVEIESYTEAGEEIGSNSEGFDPLLIDELYETCISEYLIVNTDENDIYFNTNDAGIISSCGFVEKGCVDDCFIGFRISEFQWL